MVIILSTIHYYNKVIILSIIETNNTFIIIIIYITIIHIHVSHAIVMYNSNDNQER